MLKYSIFCPHHLKIPREAKNIRETYNYNRSEASPEINMFVQLQASRCQSLIIPVLEYLKQDGKSHQDGIHKDQTVNLSDVYKASQEH